MNALHLGYVIVFGAAAVVCSLGAYRAYEIPVPDVRDSLMALLLTSGGWAAAYVGSFLTGVPFVERGFHLAGIVLGAMAVGAWLWFCSAYADGGLHRDPVALRAGLILLAVVLGTKLTNPWHGLYYTVSHQEVPFSHLALQYHSLYWVSVGLAYALAAVGYFLLYDLFRRVGSRGGALGPLAALMVLPVLMNTVAWGSFSLLDVSHEPIGVAAFAVGVFYLYGSEFRTVHAAGRRCDPAFVVDERGTLLEYNREARTFLPESRTGEEVLGKPIGEVLPEVETALEEEEPTLRFGTGPRLRYYKVERSNLENGAARPGHVLVFSNVTEHKVREEALKEESAALRRMNRVTADPEVPFEEKMSRLLNLGRNYLGLTHGFLTEVSSESQRVVMAAGSPRLVEPGEIYPLEETYCWDTVRNEGVVTARHQSAPEPGAGKRTLTKSDVQFGSYIGAKVLTDRDLFGTFCFGSIEPRSRGFSDRERSFVELLARWASHEIERRQAHEKLAQKNERLEEFASILTHDLRNPLNVAQGRLTLALEEVRKVDPSDASNPSDMLPEHLRRASRALDRMERLITDTLALTWSEQGFDDEDREKVSLEALVKDCWQQVEAPEARLRAAGDRTLYAHKGRLQQLLENLFRNAVEHGGAGITVTVGGLPDGFYVEDDGPGIPPDERSEVFERGYSTEEEGTGLGLSIARGIAEAHGWKLSYTESRDGGARFEITGIAQDT